MIYRNYVYLFKCLSHRSRLRLMELLVAHGGEMSVSAIMGAFEGELHDESFEDRDMSTISRNLNMLKQRGLVTSRREGQTKYYSLNLDKIEEEFEAFIQFLKDSSVRLMQPVENGRKGRSKPS
ncbi:MAG: hypothetical protein A2Z21_07080 [Candidatus Fraserbacteria bacterium RBG_16_55_9]|uniref:HTH arsR-type domain-containing protein n=1 Tax=Fraserbacteria sp. (strain RBG_16_55_9) TaxID=1817864 RepID=A0A1F5USN9_FRAXR|nr:MAG: hypothetical protein A2Z21_07080 [Candidatus Fraserbacteria bacterium RBG_16_55_9]